MTSKNSSVANCPPSEKSESCYHTNLLQRIQEIYDATVARNTIHTNLDTETQDYQQGIRVRTDDELNYANELYKKHQVLVAKCFPVVSRDSLFKVYKHDTETRFSAFDDSLQKLIHQHESKVAESSPEAVLYTTSEADRTQAMEVTAAYVTKNGYSLAFAELTPDHMKHICQQILPIAHPIPS